MCAFGKHIHWTRLSFIDQFDFVFLLSLKSTLSIHNANGKWLHLCSIDENKKKTTTNNITVLFACFPCTVHAYIDFVLLISASLLLWHRLISNKYYFAGHSSNVNKLSNHLRSAAYSIRYANTLFWSNTQANINYIPISNI